MNWFIAPLFQLWCFGPQKCVMSLVVSPSSSGGPFSRWNGCV
jgi:hypothetical protein